MIVSVCLKAEGLNVERLNVERLKVNLPVLF